MTKTAFITGITGQDGSYLTEHLLAHGYIVHGLVRRNSDTVRSRIDHLTRDESIYGQQLFLHYGDLDDTTTIRRILAKTKPDEVYHLAGQSHVGASFEIPESTCEFTAMGTLRFLEILRDCDPQPKFAHASSSEIFGEPDEAPQNEDTPMRPMTPYGVAKAATIFRPQIFRQIRYNVPTRTHHHRDKRDEDSIYHRHNGPRRKLSNRAPARPWLHRAWPSPSQQQHGALKDRSLNA